jgi:hypothetical protein
MAQLANSQDLQCVVQAGAVKKLRWHVKIAIDTQLDLSHSAALVNDLLADFLVMYAAQLRGP